MGTPSPPSAPRSPSASVSGDDIVVSWQPPASPGPRPLLDFTVTALHTGVSRTVGPNATNVTFSSLTKDVLYTFTITARSDAGVSPVATTNGVAIPPPDTPPVPPTTPALVPLTNPGRLLDTRADGETVDGQHQATGRRDAGSTYELPVAGRAGVPADAKSAVLNVTAVSPSGGGFVTVYPCDAPKPLASNLNYVAGDIVANTVLSRIGGDGKVCLFTLASSDLLVDVSGFFPTTTSLAPLAAPARVLDTRGDGETVDGQHQATGRIRPRTPYELPIASRVGVPESAAAAVLNVTAVNPSGGGFLTVYPCGGAVPQASNLNYLAGDIIPNAVIARIGNQGRICVFSNTETDVIVDVAGFFADDTSLRPLANPTRLLDTRNPDGATIDGQHQATGRVAAGATYELVVTDRGGVPASASTVVLNVTAVSPAGSGFVTVYPCGQQRPLASNLNYAAGDIVPNLVLARVGGGGKVCLFTLATTDLVVDVAGYFGPTA